MNQRDVFREHFQEVFERLCDEWCAKQTEQPSLDRAANARQSLYRQARVECGLPKLTQLELYVEKNYQAYLRKKKEAAK